MHSMPRTQRQRLGQRIGVYVSVGIVWVALFTAPLAADGPVCYTYTVSAGDALEVVYTPRSEFLRFGPVIFGTTGATAFLVACLLDRFKHIPWSQPVNWWTAAFAVAMVCQSTLWFFQQWLPAICLSGDDSSDPWWGLLMGAVAIVWVSANIILLWITVLRLRLIESMRQHVAIQTLRTLGIMLGILVVLLTIFMTGAYPAWPATYQLIFLLAVVCTVCAILLTLCTFQVIAASALASAAKKVADEAIAMAGDSIRAAQLARAARWTRVTALVTLAAGLFTIFHIGYSPLYVIFREVTYSFFANALGVIFVVVWVLDAFLSVFCALLLSGILGDNLAVQRDLESVGFAVRSAGRERYIFAVAAGYDFLFDPNDNDIEPVGTKLAERVGNVDLKLATDAVQLASDGRLPRLASTIGRNAEDEDEGPQAARDQNHGEISDAAERISRPAHAAGMDSPAAEAQSQNDESSSFSGLHPDVRAALEKDPSGAEEQTHILRDLCSRLTLDECKLLARGDQHQDFGGKVQPAAWAAMKQHSKETDSAAKLANCLRTLRVMGLANTIMEEAKLLLLETYPEQVQLITMNYGGGHTSQVSSRLSQVSRGTYQSRFSGASYQSHQSQFSHLSHASLTWLSTGSWELRPISSFGGSSGMSGIGKHSNLVAETCKFQRHNLLSEDGRPTYKNLRAVPEKRFIAWHQGDFGGHWSLATDEYAAQCGEQVKWAALPFDSGGDWTTAPNNVRSTRSSAQGFRHSTVHAHHERSAVMSKPLFSTQGDLIDMVTTALMQSGPGRRKRILRVLDHVLRLLVMLSADTDNASSSLQHIGQHVGEYVVNKISEHGTNTSSEPVAHKTWERVGKKSSSEYGKASRNDSGSDDAEKFRWLLTRLAQFATMIEDDEWEHRLAKELPGFPFDISFVQLMILNCRLFGLSQIRSGDFPMILIRLHDFVFRAWQQTRVSIGLDGHVITAVRYLDFNSQELRVLSEAPPKKMDALRIVVISDTHGWQLELADRAEKLSPSDLGYGKIFLPKGDILLHCGDLLNEGTPLSRNPDFSSSDSSFPLSSDEKLEEILEQLASLSVERTDDGQPILSADAQDKYRWVFLVGGNHDAPLHMLAACGRLAPLLGDSVILLQTPAEFDFPNPLERFMPTVVHSTAKSVRTESQIVSGAVRILADGSLCPPNVQFTNGVVLAGSGLSLANNAWSPNRAFQIQRDAPEKLEHAAEQLFRQSPDIVMTHGPPKGYADEKKGDTYLRNALDKSSAKVHFFGHAHSNGMGKDDRAWQLHGKNFPGRCFVNASTVTRLYMPTRLPIVADFPMGKGEDFLVI